MHALKIFLIPEFFSFFFGFNADFLFLFGMSLYQFAPTAIHKDNPGFVTWNDGFSDSEIEQIKELCETLTKGKGMVGGATETEDISAVRTSTVSWLTRTPESEWIYDRLAFIARKLNADFYGFDLFGFVEDMQYTIYDGKEQGHYDFHLDMIPPAGDNPPRKLSLVLQLSDPSKYEGGDLQIWPGGEIRNAERVLGGVTLFPSCLLHRVTPVTKGVRKSLVFWVGGVPYR